MKQIKKIRHKQSKQRKYFTLMLVPYSSQKTKTIRIPHYIIYILFGIILTVSSYFLISNLRVNKYKTKVEELEVIADNKQENLEKIISENWELLQEKNLSTEDLQRQEDEFRALIDAYKNELSTYEERALELENKIDALDKSKDDLYELLSQKIGFKPEIPFEEVASNGMYQGGGISFASMGNNSNKTNLRVTYANLEKKLEGEVKNFNLLLSVIEEHKPYIDAVPVGWPIKGEVVITSRFGSRSNPFSGAGSEGHYAIDMKASTGTPVYATGGGTISYSGLQSGYGYLIIIDHGYSLKTYYAHNSSLSVSVGEKVSRGDLIAYSGSTGRSTGPHVHYEVRLNDIPQDPLDYMD